MKTELQLHVINTVRELRNNHKLSQAGLSDILNVSYGMIGNIESTKFEHKYTLKQLHAICTYFDFPFKNLFLTNTQMSENEDKLIDLLINKLIEYNG